MHIIAVIALAVSGCQRSGTQDTRTLTLAINSGVEGDALKQAAKDYEQQTGIHINIAEFPYTNLFEAGQPYVWSFPEGNESP